MSDCYLPRLGGIEVQVHDLAHRLAEAGHAVDVFTATEGPRGEHGGQVELEGAVRVHRMGTPLTFGVPVNPFATDEVRARLREGAYDVVHAHMGVVSPFASDMVGVAQGLGLPTAVTWHCVVDRSALLWKILGQARRWAERGAALSAVSSMAARRVRAITGAPVDVLGNGIDVETWRRPLDVEGPPRTDPPTLRVVTAMRLVRRKRPEALLDVLADAQRRVAGQAHLTAFVVGDGPQRAAMQRRAKQIARAGGPAITLPGRVPRETLRSLHWHSDAYLSTARLEAFGIAALEARTAGLAVVALAETGAADFVTDGVEGLLAEDDAGLARALARLATQTRLLQRITTHNRTVAPAQSWPRVVGDTLGEYHRAISGGPR